jgi:hypothetical protein
VGSGPRPGCRRETCRRCPLRSRALVSSFEEPGGQRVSLSFAPWDVATSAHTRLSWLDSVVLGVSAQAWPGNLGHMAPMPEIIYVINTPSMALSIKSEEADQLARDLAAETGETLTEHRIERPAWSPSWRHKPRPGRHLRQERARLSLECSQFRGTGRRGARMSLRPRPVFIRGQVPPW